MMYDPNKGCINSHSNRNDSRSTLTSLPFSLIHILSITQSFYLPEMFLHSFLWILFFSLRFSRVHTLYPILHQLYLPHAYMPSWVHNIHFAKKKSKLSKQKSRRGKNKTKKKKIADNNGTIKRHFHNQPRPTTFVFADHKHSLSINLVASSIIIES